MVINKLSEGFSFVADQALGYLPDGIRENALLQMFGIKEIPMIFFVNPKVVHIDNSMCVVKIPYSWRTKNHLNCLYFGAHAVGADLAAGLQAFRMTKFRNEKISIIFKDFQAKFLKRAEGDTHFTSEGGEIISRLMDEAVETGERVEAQIPVIATVPTHLGAEPVAEFQLTLSLKKKQ
jgi:hypothetical protein